MTNQPPIWDFHQLGPLGRVGLVVDMSVCVCVCLFVPFPCDFFRRLSLVLRSHDQIPASHWSTLLPYHIVVVVVVFFRSKSPIRRRRRRGKGASFPTHMVGGVGRGGVGKKWPTSPYSAATAAGEGGWGARKKRGRDFFSRHLLKKKKSTNFFKFVLVLLSTLVERVSVSRMWDFFLHNLVWCFYLQYSFSS